TPAMSSPQEANGLEKLDLMVDYFLKIASKIEISLKASPFYGVSVPVSVVLPHIVKGRMVDWIPSKNALFALLDSALELIREEYVCYPVWVLVFVVLEEDESSNFSRLSDLY